MTTSSTAPATRHTHLLSGLDGSNLLAFMASLGALRLLELGRPTSKPRLRWEHRGVWTPILETDLSQAELVDALAAAARVMAMEPALAIGDNIKLTVGGFRDLRDRFDTAPDRTESLRWLAAFASDACVDAHSKDAHLEDTELRTMQGAGHQHFLKSIRANLAAVTPEDLEADLLAAWRYDRKGSPLRWDPADDRQHAYRWRDPSADKLGVAAGALALASAALPAFPAMPTRRGLQTTGFVPSRGGPLVTWPIWSPPMGLRVCGSLLAHHRLQDETPSRRELASLGIVDLFRSRRISVGKMRNFTPAWSP